MQNKDNIEEVFENSQDDDSFIGPYEVVDDKMENGKRRYLIRWLKDLDLEWVYDSNIPRGSLRLIQYQESKLKQKQSEMPAKKIEVEDLISSEEAEEEQQDESIIDEVIQKNYNNSPIEEEEEEERNMNILEATDDKEEDDQKPLNNEESKKKAQEDDQKPLDNEETKQKAQEAEKPEDNESMPKRRPGRPRKEASSKTNSKKVVESDKESKPKRRPGRSRKEASSKTNSKKDVESDKESKKIAKESKKSKKSKKSQSIKPSTKEEEDKPDQVQSSRLKRIIEENYLIKDREKRNEKISSLFNLKKLAKGPTIFAFNMKNDRKTLEEIRKEMIYAKEIIEWKKINEKAYFKLSFSRETCRYSHAYFDFELLESCQPTVLVNFFKKYLNKRLIEGPDT